MSAPIPDDLQDEIVSHLRFAIAAGFDPLEEVVAAAITLFGDEADPGALERYMRPMARELLAAHLTAQMAWPDVTDCDRLDAAFAALETVGIVCRQNFSCCGSCGSIEIWDEAAVLESAGRVVRGYAFYHIQDTESAVAGHGLYLNYGAADTGEAAALAIGYEIVAALQKQGLRVDWEGKASRRIGVELEWKRRRGPS